jgi:dTDP-4-dehydrorhamnose reductase
MLVKVLREDPNLKVTGTVHSPNFKKEGHRFLEVGWPDSEIEEVLEGADWVVNAIGVTKPRIDEKSPESVGEAICVNSMFPHRLAMMAERHDFRIITIATDCVYNGKGQKFYIEGGLHDATDIYGKTKSLGEVHSNKVTNLRCSIIGPELPGRKSFLLEWVRNQPRGATINGYINHSWNGITTEAFAKICRGIINDGQIIPAMQHIVPKDILTKHELLEEIAQVYGRDDLTIVPTVAETGIHRILRTNDINSNAQLWHKAGYIDSPGIRTMIEEMAALC